MVEDAEPSLDEIRTAVDALNPDDPDWSDLQWVLADALHDRHLDTGRTDDLDEAIERGQRVVIRQTEASPEHLMDLARMWWERVASDPTGAAVREYVRLNERALDLMSDNDPSSDLLPSCQANLASGLMTRSRFEPTPEDRSRAIDLWMAALESDELEDDVRAGIHANLAEAHSAGPDPSVDELDAAITHGRRAVEIGAGSDEEVAQLHFSLANALGARSERSQIPGLPAESVDQLRQGLRLLGVDHPDHPGYCVNLVSALRTLSRVTGDVTHLDEAEIVVREQVMPRVPDGHPDRTLALTMSAALISELAYWRDLPSLHAEAIALYEAAVQSALAASHEQGVALTNLAAASRDAAERLDNSGLIDSGIAAGERALRIFAGPDRHRAAALTATSNLLRDRFVTRGRVDDLDTALDLAEQALNLTPSDHQEFAARQTNLAVLLSDDYTERANRAQLDRAIALYRDALAGPEPVERRVIERQSDLALALRDRFKDAGSDEDLDEAIACAKEAADATPRASVAWAGYANNYANALAERFEADGEPADLEAAVELFRTVLGAAHDRPVEASGYATNLGLSLATLAFTSGRDDLYGEAVQHLERAVDLLPADHPDRAARMANVADVHRQRAERAVQRGDQSAALGLAGTSIGTAQQAVSAAGVSDVRLLPALANLARALRWLHSVDPTLAPADEILAVQRRSAALSQISPAERFGQSALWAEDAGRVGDREQQREAYAQAVSLTGEVAWIGLTESERLNLLGQMSEVLVAAVGLAVEQGEVWTALAWADQVRTVLARQNALVKGLGGGSASTSDAIAGSLLLAQPMPSSPDFDKEGLGHRELRRSQAHREAPRLRLPAADPQAYRSLRFPGHLVLLVPGEELAHAVLVDGSTGRERVIELPRAGRNTLAGQVRAFRSACATFHKRPDAGRVEHEMRARHGVFDVLAWLWEAVAEPVLRHVPEPAPSRPRVWWSPVGDFALLPLHAAGVHSRKTVAGPVDSAVSSRPTVPDRVISSYLPQVGSAPIGTMRAVGHTPGANGRLLYVGTDTTGGTLPQAAAERAALRRALTRVPVDELTDGEATAGAISGAIREHQFLHVAAHGESVDGDSFRMGFRLQEGVFTLTDLADCDVVDGRLAVFLACDAAAGALHSPNEALHLAGAAQQAGYPDVIAATMPLRDEPTVLAVGPLYAAVDRDPHGIGGTIARVLADTVDRLRTSPNTGSDPLAWAPYAHFGWGLDR